MAGNWSAVLRGMAHWLSLRPGRRGRVLPGGAAILGLVPDGPNRRDLEAISHDTGLALRLADADCIESVCQDGLGPPPIILYDVAAAPRTWHERIRVLARNSPRPYIILLSANASPNLWDELQRAGAADILRTPISREHFVEAIAKGRQLRSAQERLLSPVRPATK